MRKLTLKDIYEVGQRLVPLRNMDMQTKKTEAIMDMYWAKEALNVILEEPSPLLEVGKRAARKLVAAISAIVPNRLADAFQPNADKNDTVGYEGWNVHRMFEEFESVLSNEMPSVPAYIVSKKGIYNTDDLITRATGYFPEAIRGGLSEQAKLDICEAGKCLAFELSTACSFHLWRAVEETMCAYYTALTGKGADQLKNKNWGTIIEALKGHPKVDTSVTSFLDHIREAYRNPLMHPEVMVSLDEALSMFGAAASCINQQIMAIQKLGAQTSLPLGLGAGSTALAALALGPPAQSS